MSKAVKKSKKISTVIRMIIKQGLRLDANILKSDYDGKPYRLFTSRDERNDFLDVELTTGTVGDYNGFILSEDTLGRVQENLGADFGERMDSICIDVQIVTSTWDEGSSYPIEWDYGQ